MAHLAARRKSKTTCFYDLTAELRIAVYEIYASESDRTTVSFARGHFVPQPLALASRQIRSEFLAHWDGIDILGDETRHIRLAVYNFEYADAIAFWERAAALVDRRDEWFDTVRVSIITNDTWGWSKAMSIIPGYFQWWLESGVAICASGDDEHWELLHEGRFPFLGVMAFCVGSAWYSVQQCRSQKRKIGISDAGHSLKGGVRAIKSKRMRQVRIKR